MTEPTAAEPLPTDDAGRALPLALLVSEEGEPVGLKARLEEAGCRVACVGPGAAAGAARAHAPAFVLLAFGAREEEGRLVSLARRLRAEPATFALPVVFLFREDARTLRSAAQHFGADDYFSQEATAAELRARLAALLWRAGAGRRAAPFVAEQRSEIDNFLILLDAVGHDARAGGAGVVALVEAAPAAGADADEQTLAAVHGFLKLNLRRVDAVAFYGPATLLVYLPRASAAAARALLAGLRGEFLSARPQADLRAGLATFPADGVEAERLVERAGAALAEARTAEPHARVRVYGEEQMPAAARQESARRGPATPGNAATAPPPQTSARHQPEGTRVHAAAHTSDAGAQRPKARRLMLIISDAERMAQVNLLLRSAGYEARAAFDGQHALGLLRIDSPDLLLIDYELQGMDGVEVLRRLRRQSGRGQPPPAVLLLPGGREDLRREALDAGARAALHLPYDPVELLEALDGVGEPL